MDRLLTGGYCGSDGRSIVEDPLASRFFSSRVVRYHVVGRFRKGGIDWGHDFQPLHVFFGVWKETEREIR